ncbi:B3 domain-containing protein [Hordeum vulgare]|nr:B3 domain-containing protein [Hordeum vulgare]
MKLRHACSGLRRLWDMEVVFDTDDRMYLDHGWKKFVRAYDLRHGYFLVFSIWSGNGRSSSDSGYSKSISNSGYSKSSSDNGYTKSSNDSGYSKSRNEDEEEWSVEEEE